ncbi:MAG TPA: YciI family protein [Bryobacteraceae bacterium]|jgi:hypothetical protein|nr:YciI family protein [Bryobacteraceae bacterium]
MKYMLLIYSEEDAWSEEERQECYATSTELANELHADGKFLGASPLHPASTATCVRVRNARPLITDGPFAEAREQLGGYFMVEARDLDEALAIAARIPAAVKGTIEVRPVVEITNLPENLGRAADLAGALHST